MEPRVRAFVAIELDRELQEGLGRVQQRLKRVAGAGVRWVRPEAIHLTLKFLGDVETARLAQVCDAMGQAAGRARPFRLRLGAVGAFPSLRRPRVLWAGVEGDLDALQLVQGELDAALQVVGFPREERPFVPHLTLGRVRPGATLESRDADWDAAAPEGPQAEQRVQGISLIRSDLRPDGPLYTRLALAHFPSLPPGA